MGWRGRRIGNLLVDDSNPSLAHLEDHSALDRHPPRSRPAALGEHVHLAALDQRHHHFHHLVRLDPQIVARHHAQYIRVVRPQRRSDHAGRDAGDADAEALLERSERAHEAVDPVLGGHVERHREGRCLPRDGRDVDDGLGPRAVLGRAGGTGAIGEKVGDGELGGANRVREVDG